MSVLSERLDVFLRAGGVPITGVSIGRDDDRTTWRVSPSTVQAQAQPLIDAFVMPTPTQIADDEAAREADLRILKAIVIELHAAIPAWAGKPTLAQLRANIIARFKALA